MKVATSRLNLNQEPKMKARHLLLALGGLLLAASPAVAKPRTTTAAKNTALTVSTARGAIRTALGTVPGGWKVLLSSYQQQVKAKTTKSSEIISVGGYKKVKGYEFRAISNRRLDDYEGEKLFRVVDGFISPKKAVTFYPPEPFE
jgi:hypothetical protein